MLKKPRPILSSPLFILTTAWLLSYGIWRHLLTTGSVFRAFVCRTTTCLCIHGQWYQLQGSPLRKVEPEPSLSPSENNLSNLEEALQPIMSKAFWHVLSTTLNCQGTLLTLSASRDGPSHRWMRRVPRQPLTRQLMAPQIHFSVLSRSLDCSIVFILTEQHAQGASEPDLAIKIRDGVVLKASDAWTTMSISIADSCQSFEDRVRLSFDWEIRERVNLKDRESGITHGIRYRGLDLSNSYNVLRNTSTQFFRLVQMFLWGDERWRLY